MKLTFWAGVMVGALLFWWIFGTATIEFEAPTLTYR